jgi:Fe-Mn family superoxide dismutase
MKRVFFSLGWMFLCHADPIVPIDFSYLKEKMPKLDPKLLDIHLALYQGYVQQVNFIDENMLKATDPFMKQALRKQYGFEYDGARLHELYFSQLGGKGYNPKVKLRIGDALIELYGSMENFIDQVKSYAKTRGIGWVILFGEIATSKIKLSWVGDHEKGLLSGWIPLLVIDLWEHAYICQYGLNKESYVDLCFEYMDWSVVNKRYVNECKLKSNAYKKHLRKDS